MGKIIEKWRIITVLLGAVVLALCVAAIILSGTLKPVCPLSLVFVRYSDDFDWHVQDVAFLLLTNASNRSYGVTMPGRSNTFIMDTVFKRATASYLVNCEFTDQTSNGWTNWAQKFPALTPFMTFRGTGAHIRLTSVVVASSGAVFTTIGPHTGITIRVPTLPGGQRRRIAVLCQEMPELRPSSFWFSRAGRLLLVNLPRSIVSRLYSAGPVLKVWCDRELSRAEAGAAALPTGQ